METTPSMDWATPMKPALVPTGGRQIDGPRQSDPPPPATRGPPNNAHEGGRHTYRPLPPGRPRGVWAGVMEGNDPPTDNRAAPGAQGTRGDRGYTSHRGGLGRDLQATPQQPPGNQARGPEGGGGELRRDLPPPLSPLPPCQPGGCWRPAKGASAL